MGKTYRNDYDDEDMLMARGVGKAKRGCGCVHGPSRGPRKVRGFDSGGFVETHPGTPEFPDMHTQGEEYSSAHGVPQAFQSQQNNMLPNKQQMGHENLIMQNFRSGGSVRRGRR